MTLSSGNQQEAGKQTANSAGIAEDAGKDRSGHGFDVFLCYNSADKEEVKRIGRQLQGRKLHPWLDEWEITPGRSWQDILDSVILNVRSAAVFVGKRGFGPWQREEIKALLEQFVRRECPVILVLLKSYPKSKSPPQLPPFLGSIQWVDFRDQKPDLAPLDRLVWGITGQKQAIGNRNRRGPNLRSWIVAIATLVLVAGSIALWKRANHVETRGEPTLGGGRLQLVAGEILDAVFADTAPNIDGKLDEPLWRKAKTLLFAKHPPANDASEAKIRLLWDEKFLYAALEVSDTHVEDSGKTPWNGDSVSVVISPKLGRKPTEYRHSLLRAEVDIDTRENRHDLSEDRAGPVKSACQLMGATTFNDTSNADEGFIVEMRIPWPEPYKQGDQIPADFISVDHDGNPGAPFDDPETIFSKISWDGDASVDTANTIIRLTD